MAWLSVNVDSNSHISVMSSPSYDLLLNESLTMAVFFFCWWCGLTPTMGIGWTLSLGMDAGKDRCEHGTAP